MIKDELVQAELSPKISVIMSVYNGANYLDKGVLSIINQTFKDWEFLICDDGSSDETYDKLLQYQKVDPRIRVVRNENNMGLAFSLNRLIEMSRSNILARQDADDESALDRFEVQYPYVLGHPEYAIVGTSWFNVDENQNKEEYYPLEYPQMKDMVWDGGFMHPSWMMRKDHLEQVGFYTANNYTKRDQDYHLVMKVYGANMKMCNIQQCLYFYTNDSGTFKRTKTWKNVKGLIWIRYDGYRRNKLPFWTYIFVLKPLIKNLLPQKITYLYYLHTQKRKGNK